MIENIKHKSVQNNNTEISIVENPRAEHYFKEAIKKYDRDYYSDYALNKEAFEELLEFNDFAKSKNVEVVYFVTPMHIYDLVNINMHGLTDEFYEFKKLLAQYFNYYDLSLINEYNTEPVSVNMKYFRDAVHATEYFGSFFAQCFYIKPNNSAVFITKENVNKYIETDKKNLDDYITNNPEVVKQIKEWID